MTADYDFNVIDDDTLLDDSAGWAGGGGGDNFWNYKAGQKIEFYMVTDFWTARADHGWANWRECFAREGLAGGVELPGGLKGVPVRDFVVNQDGKRVNIPIESPEADPLLRLVVPYTDKKSKRPGPQRPVTDKVGLNIVEVADDGTLYHKVLVLTGPRGAKLKRQLQSWREMVDGFSAVGRRFVLTTSGQGAAEVLSVSVVKDPPPVDIPEPIDILQKLQERREGILALVESWTGVDTSAARDIPEDPVTAQDVTADFDPAFSQGPELDPAFTQPVVADLAPTEPTPPPYESMTDARLRSLLTKKGHTPPPKTPRAKLLEMAVEHGV